MPSKLGNNTNIEATNDSENSIIDDSTLCNQSKTMRKTYSTFIEKMTTLRKPFRFDFIVVSLKIKDQPNYQYFKNIIDI